VNPQAGLAVGSLELGTAYISQPILTSQTAMAKERASEDEAEHLGRYFLESLGRSPGTSLQEQSLADNSAAACPGPGMPANPGSDQERLAS
jgi:hypothetical protein